MTKWIQRAPGASQALQSLVDDLAEELGRSVVLDDPLIRLICSSRHFGDEDPVRIRGLLQGMADAEIIRYVLSQGVAQWVRADYLQGRDDLGLLPRYCVPLREKGHLLGILMVVAPDKALTSAETEAIAQAGHAVAAQMYAERLASDADEAHRQFLVRQLVGPDGSAREAARQRCLEDGMLPDAPHALVTSVVVAGRHVATGEVEIALRGSLEALLRTRTARGALAIEQDRAVLVQAFEQEPTAEDRAAQSRRIARSMATFLDPSWTTVVGVGGRQDGLGDAWISFDQARVAARAARRLPQLMGVGDWDELGEYAVLLQLPSSALGESLVPKALRRLLDSHGTPRLEETLRCFLENAGSVPRTAETLQIHRTSLYYRLRQIQEITGLDLDNGAHRLVLHMGLRLWDLLEAPELTASR
ncbi:PucR family transcriptional regulator [Streptacidiphilus fuscans]|uniref:Helix-turn-helix domain-containing protein n=1 Tax=Streptacidiphilus fuscans TaxID=2789292 RepID=A0A931FCH8_9ACTN|nr:helix-turn-helix domain-containing protein [Streptacidiphilus fuscans]MBF9066456.1 helix-turn-helix domain-containing protein [Streptacidiphilus fuscans]